jgi:hypothetical protein
LANDSLVQNVRGSLSFLFFIVFIYFCAVGTC